MKKVYIETYGCSSNQNDSEIMEGLLAKEGYDITKNEKDADLIIINTCTVKHTTEQRIRSRIKHFSDKKLVIAGCMAEAQPALLRSIAPGASIVSTNRIDYVCAVATDTIKGRRTEVLGKQKTEKPLLAKKIHNPAVDILEIESGCDFACTFCATKLAKGSTFSYAPDSIVNEIKKTRNTGISEYWITGQDVAGYNHNSTRLPDLIEKITSSVRGGYFLRIGMQHPASTMHVLGELIEAYKSDHVFKFLHLPVQSGSDAVLKAMGRKHSADDFVYIVKKFRHAFPEITVWTDIIAGFPGESGDDFAMTLELLRKTKPDFTNVSAFGLRPDTKAAKMKQVNTETKKERTRALTKLCNELCLEANKKWIGWTGSVLVDEYNVTKSTWVARNYAYKPVVLAGKHDYNEFLDVKIKSAAATHLVGEIE